MRIELLRGQARVPIAYGQEPIENAEDIILVSVETDGDDRVGGNRGVDIDIQVEAFVFRGVELFRRPQPTVITVTRLQAAAPGRV
jgi:hypothetical protein